MQNSTLQTTAPTTRQISPAWQKAGTDYILPLGKHKRGIVIRRFQDFIIGPTKFWYSIAMASQMPFTDDEFKARFDTADACIFYAEDIVKEWLQSFFTASQVKAITEN